MAFCGRSCGFNFTVFGVSYIGELPQLKPRAGCVLSDFLHLAEPLGMHNYYYEANRWYGGSCVCVCVCATSVTWLAVEYYYLLLFLNNNMFSSLAWLTTGWLQEVLMWSVTEFKVETETETCTPVPQHAVLGLYNELRCFDSKYMIIANPTSVIWKINIALIFTFSN